MAQERIDSGAATRIFSTFTNPNDTQSTVILGAGIIGCATAYYLSHSGNTKTDTIHLVESAPELFQSASGKAAGFCVSDWFGPSTAELGALSFKLHEELAEKHDGKKQWGWSRSTGSSLMEGNGPEGKRGEDWLRDGGSRAEVAAIHQYAGEQAGPAWLTRRSGDKLEVISEDKGVGQVDPLRLCRFLLRESILKGVRLHHPAAPIKLSSDESNEMSALRIRHYSGAENKIPCTRLVITAGAWTPDVFDRLFPASKVKIPISPLAGHSLVVRSPRWAEEHEAEGCHAIFSTGPDGYSPEIFSRVGGEIYIAGLNDASISLPPSPEKAKVDRACIAALKRTAERLLGKDGTDVSDLQVLREGLCFRPVTSRGTPVIARVEDEKLGGGIETKYGNMGGIFVAAGHGPWGISHSLGTGKVMQELVESQPLSADISKLGL